MPADRAPLVSRRAGRVRRLPSDHCGGPVGSRCAGRGRRPGPGGRDPGSPAAAAGRRAHRRAADAGRADPDLRGAPPYRRGGPGRARRRPGPPRRHAVDPARPGGRVPEELSATSSSAGPSRPTRWGAGWSPSASWCCGCATWCRAAPPPLPALDHVPATAATVARRALWLDGTFDLAGASVLCVGDHDLTSLALARLVPGVAVTVVDLDERVLAHIDEQRLGVRCLLRRPAGRAAARGGAGGGSGRHRPAVHAGGGPALPRPGPARPAGSRVRAAGARLRVQRPATGAGPEGPAGHRRAAARDRGHAAGFQPLSRGAGGRQRQRSVRAAAHRGHLERARAGRPGHVARSTPTGRSRSRARRPRSRPRSRRPPGPVRCRSRSGRVGPMVRAWAWPRCCGTGCRPP